MNAAIELVNSEWWRGRPEAYEDRLDDRAWRAAFLVPIGAAPRVADLRRLRALLRRLVEAPSAADWDALDAIVAAAPVRRRVRDGRVTVEPAAQGPRWTLAQIAVAFTEALAAGPVRICANDECGWAFVDRSKNRSRRWCGAPSCGDRARVRRHRARRSER